MATEEAKETTVGIGEAAPRQLGHYEVLEKIGQGGMAVVYKGVQPSLNRAVAIKVLPKQFASTPELLGRFEREASIIAQLNHSNIVVSDQHVSNQHAVIEPGEQGHLLRDLNSRHGMWINGHLVESALLAQGDQIRIGPLTLMYESNPSPATTFTEERVKLRATSVEGLDQPSKTKPAKGDTIA